MAVRQQVTQVKEEAIASPRQTVSPTHQNKKPQSQAALLLQLQRTHGNRYVRQHLNTVPKQLSSLGKLLDPATLSLMETHFGCDFKQVRVHTDTQAASSAEALKVRAYTTNQNIVFGAGQYQPATDAGQRLIAHELAHTIQQSQGNAANEFSEARYRQAEAEADRVARRLDSNGGVYSPTLFIPSPTTISVGMPSGLIQAEEEGRSWYERTGAWLLGAVGGEFIDEQDFGQIGVDFVLSVIPIVDQAADARDLIAHLYRLGYRGEHNHWERWLSLAFTLIGLVPEIGSVIKSLSKAAMRGFKTVLAHIGDLLSLARKLIPVDISDIGRFRQYILRNWSNFVKQGMDVWDLLLSKGALTERLPRLADLRRISPQWLTRAFDHLRQVIDDALDQLSRHFGEPQLVGVGKGANIPGVPQPKRAEIMQMSGVGSKQSRFTNEEIAEVMAEDIRRGKPASITEKQLAIDAPTVLSSQQLLQRFRSRLSDIERHHSFFRYLLRAISKARRVRGIPRHGRLTQLPITQHNVIHELFDLTHPNLSRGLGASDEIAKAILRGEITPTEIADLLLVFYRDLSRNSPDLLPSEMLSQIERVIQSIRSRGGF